MYIRVTFDFDEPFLTLTNPTLTDPILRIKQLGRGNLMKSRGVQVE